MIRIKRCSQNPLICPKDVKPSREDFKVDGIFNCGVTRYKDEIFLLCRVAESVKTISNEVVKIPIVTNKSGRDEIEIVTLVKSEYPHYDFSDSREINQYTSKGKRIIYLTSLSHLRLARSKDGINFIVDESPFVFPTAKEEGWGMEDPRITQIEDVFYINYTSVTENGAATSLIHTKDFKTYHREGIIFAPENKDVTIFPAKIDNKYIAFNRPVPSGIGDPDMWIAESYDLVHWGKQQHFVGISKDDSWDNGRIGGGAVPFMTRKGWIKIYHGADAWNRYCLGVFLLDAKNPHKILAKTKEPILQPYMDYEKEGFFGNVVFSCGCILEGETVIIYYGAADDKICRVDITLQDIYDALVYL